MRVRSVCVSLAIFALPASAQQKTEFVEGNEVVANEVLVKSRVSANGPAFVQALQAHQIDNVQTVGVNGWRLLHSSGSSAAALLRAFRASSAVELAEPNYLVHANLIPNDPYWPNLYGMRIISGPDAWDLSTGSSANVVAVIDTGFSYNHPDLADYLWSGGCGWKQRHRRGGGELDGKRNVRKVPECWRKRDHRRRNQGD